MPLELRRGIHHELYGRPERIPEVAEVAVQAIEVPSAPIVDDQKVDIRSLVRGSSRMRPKEYPEPRPVALQYRAGESPDLAAVRGSARR